MSCSIIIDKRTNKILIMNQFVICFDTETTGLSPEKDRIIQISWIVVNIVKNRIVCKHDYIIRIDEDIHMGERAFAAHGISMEKSKKVGKPIGDVLKSFITSVKSTGIIVGHNVNFDINMVNAECQRNNISSPFTLFRKDKIYCTMYKTISLCKIQFDNVKQNKFTSTSSNTKRYKYPSLSELHNHLFGDMYVVNKECLHNSLYDVLLTLHCYMYLVYNVDLYCEVPDEYSLCLRSKPSK